MSIIYRLIDEAEKADIQKNNRISLSRPLLKYGEPEGLIVEFFRDINKLIEKTQDVLKIEPTEELLCKIKEWYMMYFNSFPEEIKKSYSDYDILSDLRILMCVYFQTYCGYFTHAKLDSPETRNKYFHSNKKFIEKFNKKAYIRIDIKSNKLDNVAWEYTPSKSQTDFVFTPSSFEREWHNNILSTLHLHDVIYLNNKLSASQIFSKFNFFEKRNSSCWFKFTKEYLNSQQEKRLIFYLPSYKINCSRVACDNIFSNMNCETLEEVLFYYAVSTLQYAKDNFPQYVYLKVQDFKIFDI